MDRNEIRVHLACERRVRRRLSRVKKRVDDETPLLTAHFKRARTPLRTLGHSGSTSANLAAHTRASQHIASTPTNSPPLKMSSRTLAMSRLPPPLLELERRASDMEALSRVCSALSCREESDNDAETVVRTVKISGTALEPPSSLHNITPSGSRWQAASTGSHALAI
jgi:hypothetical protein